MEKTNPEPLQEAKSTAAANSGEKQNAGGTPKANPVKRTIAVIGSVLSILSLETPWLLAKPSILKLSLLLAGAILGGLLFGLGFTSPEFEKEKEKGISGWPLLGLYLIVSLAAALIYCCCPNLRINGWLYVLINLVEALVAGLLCWFLVLIMPILFAAKPVETKEKLFFGAAKILSILAVIAAAVCTVYFGWPILQNNSSPILAMLLPGFFLGGSALAGEIVLLVLFSPFLKKATADYKNKQNV